MKTWQQRHDEEAARRAEVEETLAQIRRGERPLRPRRLDEPLVGARLAEPRPPHTPAPPAPRQDLPAAQEPPPAPPVVDLTERIVERATEIPRVASQPPAGERCACGHKGISHPRWGKCNRLACGCGSFRGCA